MPFSRGAQWRSDPCQGPSGGVFRAQNLHFSPTRFHEDPEKPRASKACVLEGTWSGISASRMATCIGFRRLGAIFTGFDSAWSAANSGAICDLVLLEDG